MSALIHPEAEAETFAFAVKGISRGRDEIVETLLETGEDGVYTIVLDRVDEVGPGRAVIHAHSRRRTSPRGMADGQIRWQIEMRDGMLWRSRLLP